MLIPVPQDLGCPDMPTCCAALGEAVPCPVTQGTTVQQHRSHNNPAWLGIFKALWAPWKEQGKCKPVLVLCGYRLSEMLKWRQNNSQQSSSYIPRGGHFMVWGIFRGYFTSQFLERLSQLGAGTPLQGCVQNTGILSGPCSALAFAVTITSDKISVFSICLPTSWFKGNEGRSCYSSVHYKPTQMTPHCLFISMRLLMP